MKARTWFSIFSCIALLAAGLPIWFLAVHVSKESNSAGVLIAYWLGVFATRVSDWMHKKADTIKEAPDA